MLLAALADGPAHGYLVIKRLRERSGGVLDYPEGSVYPAFHRMEDAGLIVASQAVASGRPRKIYHLTRKGRAALGTEAEGWRRFASGVESVLEGLA